MCRFEREDGCVMLPTLLSVALLGQSALTAPTNLIILVHGLYGGDNNLRVLRDTLQILGHGSVVVVSSGSNIGKTRDGVMKGGLRLVDEIRDAIQRHPSLQTISMVGNSLGGLYVRYAAGILLEKDGTMAGLTPDALVTIGCPHLGVRKFTFIPLPSALHELGWIVAGRTADDLLLRTPVLGEMAREGSRFHEALRAFRRRRLYANLKGDFMVPFGTAAIQARGWGHGIGDDLRAACFADRADAIFVDQQARGGTEKRERDT